MCIFSEIQKKSIVSAPEAAGASSKSSKVGILEGRTVAPCKSTRWLTDMQIRKIGIVALAIMLTLGPILIGVVTGGAGAIILGAMWGIIGMSIGVSIFMTQWPRADFQTSKGAEKIINDLKTKSLAELRGYYNFWDLSKYGYISVEDAKKMQDLYDQMPHYRTVWNGDRVDWYASYCVNKVSGVFEERESTENKFSSLRHSPGFGVWKHT
jgi:hypothetical protein